MDERINDFEFLHALLRSDFKSFAIKVFNEVSAGAQYLDNWHIDVVCNEIEQMISGDNNRLIVNIPPRNMKSIICSVALPAYLLGLNPQTQIICVSYADELTKKFANDCRTVMETAWYADLFPCTKIDHRRSATMDFQTTRGGGRFSTTINGTLTGRGGDWIIIDDPLKASDGLSDVLRNKVNDWYATTLYSRLNNKNTGKILVIMQRLHQSDLTGYLLEKQSGFRHITIPMIAEGNEDWSYTDKFGYRHDIARHAGELLHPEREDMNSVAHLRQTLGEYAFAGQYQQRPVPKDGGLVKRSWLHFYNELPQRFKHIFLSWDTASKTGITNAYSACAVFGVGIDNRVYLLAVERGRLEYPALLKRVAELHTQTQQAHGNCPTTTLIEDASSGTALIQQLRAQHRMTVEPIKPISDKESRLNATTAYIQNGTIVFPNTAGAWWPDFLDELLTFPASTFKDQCDAFSQGIGHIDGLYLSARRGYF